MTKTRLFQQVLAALAFALVLTPDKASAQSFEPAGTMKAEGVMDLPIRPVAMAEGGGAVFVVGFGDYGPGRVIRIDPASLKVTASADLDYAPAALTVSPDGQLIAIAGARQNASGLSLMDGNLQPLGALRGLPRLLSPSVNLAGNDRLLVGSWNGTGGDRGFAAVDISDPRKPLIDETLSGIGNYRGITDGWMDWGNSVLFLNTVDEPALLAVDTSGKVINEFRPREKSTRGGPFVVNGITSDNACASNSSSSFLLADSDSQKLTVARYDNHFDTLELQSTVLAAPRILPGARIEMMPGTNILRPSALLASSCDRGVIWVGGLHSNQIIQYALNSDINVLEKVGVIELPRAPHGLLVMADGSYGFTLDDDNRHLQRMLPGDQIIGNPSIRAVQRELSNRGFSLGAIDGLDGDLTTRALNIFEKQNGIRISPTTDPDSTLQILQKAY